MGGNSGGVGIVTSAIQAGFSWGAYAQEQSAIYEEMKFNKAVNEHNARLADNAAADAITRGNADASVIQAKGAQSTGAQTTALASSGVDLSVGSAMDILAGTKAMTDFDASMTKNNAQRDEWMIRNKAQEIRKQGELDERKAWNKTAQTFLSEMQRQGEYMKMASNSSDSGKAKGNKGGGSSSSSDALGEYKYYDYGQDIEGSF